MQAVKGQAILLAEDDDNEVFFLERAFKQARIGTSLNRVKDGEEAISYLRGEGEYGDRTRFPLPKLLVVDLKMPRKTGFEVIAWVRQQPVLKRLPIVVMTSSTTDLDVNRSYDLGANTYLVKPVELESLVEMLTTLNLFWLELAQQPNLSS